MIWPRRLGSATASHPCLLGLALLARGVRIRTREGRPLTEPGKRRMHGRQPGPKLRMLRPSTPGGCAARRVHVHRGTDPARRCRRRLDASDGAVGRGRLGLGPGPYPHPHPQSYPYPFVSLAPGAVGARRFVSRSYPQGHPHPRVQVQWGKEVVSRFVSGLGSGEALYTDSNGREMQRRQLNSRPSWKLDQTEPVAGNYFPVNTAAFVRDAAAQQTCENAPSWWCRSSLLRPAGTPGTPRPRGLTRSTHSSAEERPSRSNPRAVCLRHSRPCHTFDHPL